VPVIVNNRDGAVDISLSDAIAKPAGITTLLTALRSSAMCSRRTGVVPAVMVPSV
jgi:hypothetical protein